MKYFFDTEFLEGTQKTMFGNTKPTIDLISIGIVDETGREFYAISNEFNLKEAWNRWDGVRDPKTGEKVYWIRDNVLRSIWLEYIGGIHKAHFYPFTYRNMKAYFEKYGKSNIEIANGIFAFVYGDDCGGSGMSAIEMATKYGAPANTKEPEFYAYYASYDWVSFCWIFGRMLDLPKDFPMYCKDLKQMLDEAVMQKATEIDAALVDGVYPVYQNKGIETPGIFKAMLNEYKKSEEYPKQRNEHNALDDAKWNFELYKFISKI